MSVVEQCPTCRGTGSVDSGVQCFEGCGCDRIACDTCDGEGSVAPASSYARAVLTPEIAAVAATLVDLAKHNLPPHISEAQQVEAYLALRRVARGSRR